MTIRFTDIIDSKNNINTANDTVNVRHDFVTRKRRPLWQTLFIMFASIIPVAVILSLLVTDTIVFTISLIMLFGILGVYVIFVIQRSRDLVLATEFQNALFSSALGHSNKFCLIIKNDNTIAYIDQSLQELFPNFWKEPHRAIDVLLEQGQVSKNEREMIFTAIGSRIRSKVIFDLIDNKNKTHRIIMTIEPISRPKGFVLLRGREFVEKRVLGPQLPNNSKTSIFNKDNLNLFSYIMDSMDIGAYMINLLGNITYANLTLEQWLDFDENELTTNELSLKDIISQTGLNTYVTDLKNFNGEAFLKKKISGQMKTLISQKAMYDEQGTIIGYAALVHQVKDELPSTDIKKQTNDTW